MKKNSLLILLFFSFFFTNAQNLITLQHNGFSTFHTNLDTAISKSIDGDSIYLPGGTFGFRLPISKTLHFIGVGHHPDSTNATYRTIIGNVDLDSGASSGSITGIYILGQVSIIGNVNGYSIRRCNIVGGIRTTSYFNYPKYFIINENVIGGYDICYSCGNWFSILINGVNSSFLLSNNIIQAKVDIKGATLENNIFLFAGVALQNTTTCYFKNNIFKITGNISSGGSIFRNNLNGGLNGIDNYGNQGSGNFSTTISIDSIFINSNSSIWSYTYDYHLRANSSYKNAGTDGTDLGIYGGVFPWKEGSIPFNPHFQIKTIAPKTNNNGALPVFIKVKAQGN